MKRILFITLLFPFGSVFADTNLDKSEKPVNFRLSDISLDNISYTFGLSPESLNIFDLSTHFKYKQKQSFFFTTGAMVYNPTNDIFPMSIGFGISKTSDIFKINIGSFSLFEKSTLSLSMNKQSDKKIYYNILSFSVVVYKNLLIGGAIFSGSYDNNFLRIPLPIIALRYELPLDIFSNN